MLCSTCNLEKEASHFYIHSNGKPRKQCKKCFVDRQPRQTKEQYTFYAKKRWKENKEIESLKYKKWRTSNLNKAKEKSATYSARKKKQMPSWANRDIIKEIYSCCPPGHHVDHIIPLKGELVCGLHIETNLQYLPASENIRKKNKYEEDNLAG